MTAIYNATHYFSTTVTVLLLRHLVKHVVAKNRTPSQLHAVTIALAKELLLLAWISGGSIWRFYSLGPGLRRLLGCGAWRLLVLAHLIAARHSVIIVLLSLIFKTALVDASPYSPLQNLFVRTDMINNTVRNSNLHTVHRNTISQGSDCTISGPFSQHQLGPFFSTRSSTPRREKNELPRSAWVLCVPRAAKCRSVRAGSFEEINPNAFK